MAVAINTLSPLRGEDLTGRRFGRLSVIAFVGIHSDPNGTSVKMWRCRCDCSVEVVVRQGKLKSGHSRSCSCLQKDTASANATRHGYAPTRSTAHPIYKAWLSMKSRCTYSDRKDYKYYGGRGVSIGSRWLSFDNFLEDMGPTWGPGLTLDRIDPNGNYGPGLCKWSTQAEQASNKRSTMRLEFMGEMLTLVEWSKRTQIDGDTLRLRFHRGWSAERILTRWNYGWRRELETP